MELVVFLVALVVFDLLAWRFGVDSRVAARPPLTDGLWTPGARQWLVD